MKTNAGKTKVTKGFYVEAILDDDPPNQNPHKVTRNYQTIEAANEMAEVFRKQLRQPESVKVRTRFGFDDCEQLCRRAAGLLV